MTDAMTKQPLRALGDRQSGVYIRTPLDQLDRVLSLFDRHKIAHWVEPTAISVDGKPAIAFINFDFSIDPARVQAVLDEAP